MLCGVDADDEADCNDDDAVVAVVAASPQFDDDSTVLIEEQKEAVRKPLIECRDVTRAR